MRGLTRNFVGVSNRASQGGSGLGSVLFSRSVLFDHDQRLSLGLRHWYGLGERRRGATERRTAALMTAPAAQPARLRPEVPLGGGPVDGPPQGHQVALEPAQLLFVG